MMKSLITLAAATAIIGGTSMACAQNGAPTTKSTLSPNNINTSYMPDRASGSEDTSAATNSPAQVIGNGKFCKKPSVNGPLECSYMSEASCEQDSNSNLRCVANPNAGT